MSTLTSRRPATLWPALAVVYVVWGSTYLGIRVVVESTPPLIAMGTRFVFASFLLATIMAARYGVRALLVPWRSLAATALVGALLLSCGNGGVAVAEQTVPSGLAALLIASVPLWLVCLRLFAGDRPRLPTLVGTALGFAGIAVLARPGGHSSGEPVETWGLLVLVAASIGWSVGSFTSSRLPMPPNPFIATVWEMLAGGLLMLVAGTARGELDGFAVSDVPLKAWLWLLYLAVIGSVVAFSSYVWLLQNAALSLTATYAYVNPVVAVILGALVLSEPITATILAGGAVVVLGVVLVVSTERPRRTLVEPPAPIEPPEPATRQTVG